MALVSKSDLELLTNERGRCVSIYMPTYRAGPDVRQNAIRLKDLLKHAETQLVAAGMRQPEAIAALEPAHRLMQDYEFWQKQGDGLILFVHPRLFRAYHVPFSLDERVVVNDRFYLKPLLALLHEEGGAYLVLALSQSQVRLYECSRTSAAPVDLDGLHVPQTIEQALQNDQLQEQTGRTTFKSGSPTGKYGQTAISSGEGTRQTDSSTNIVRFFRQVDAGLRKWFGDKNRPMVLAGVEYLHPLYRQVTAYPHLVAEGLRGNVIDLKPEELCRRAYPLVEPIFDQPREQMINMLHQFLGERNQHASNDLREVVPAAYYGRVATLFVDPDAQVWGQFDPATRRLEVHPQPSPSDEDLLDRAAVQTFLNNGAVFTLSRQQLPGKAPVAAVFRY